MPLFVRKFIVDFVEKSIAAILVLNLVFPTSITQAQQEGVVVALALAGAGVSAVRRALPDLVGWLTSAMKVPPSG